MSTVCFNSFFSVRSQTFIHQFLIDVVETDGCTLFCKSRCNSKTDTIRSACYKGDFTFQRKIQILEYTDQVKIRVLVPKTEVDRLCAEITEGTNGKAKLEKEEELYFAQNDGELIFGDALTQYKNLEAEELG